MRMCIPAVVLSFLRVKVCIANTATITTTTISFRGPTTSAICFRYRRPENIAGSRIAVCLLPLCIGEKITLS